MSLDAPESTNSRFVAYLDASDRVEYGTSQLDCTTSWFRTVSSTYGTCCAPNVDCRVPTTCLDDILYYRGSTSVCTSSRTCSSITLLPRSGDDEVASQSTVDFFCNHTSIGRPFSVVYLEDPAFEEGGSRTVSGPKETGSSGRDDSGGELSRSRGSDSKAWMAGAVLGPVVLLALIRVRVFFLLRKRGRDQTKQQPPGLQGPHQGIFELHGSQHHAGASSAPHDYKSPQHAELTPDGINELYSDSLRASEIHGSERYENQHSSYSASVAELPGGQPSNAYRF